MTPEEAYEAIRQGLNMDAEGATPEEVVAQVYKIYDEWQAERRATALWQRQRQKIQLGQ